MLCQALPFYIKYQGQWQSRDAAGRRRARSLYANHYVQLSQGGRNRHRESGLHAARALVLGWDSE